MKEEGFAQPKAVKDATMSYQHDSDKSGTFCGGISGTGEGCGMPDIGSVSGIPKLVQ